PAVEVVTAEVAVVDGVAQHVIGGHKQRGSHRDDGFWAAPGLEAHVLRPDVGVLHLDGGPGRLNECGLEPPATPAHADATALRRALVEAAGGGGRRNRGAQGAKTTP